ncbi:putative MFS transporter [Biscogniauxia sp. FL1348]|nr:putative MFS transporter [Biscogniauxia sp. FL1348]
MAPEQLLVSEIASIDEKGSDVCVESAQGIVVIDNIRVLGLTHEDADFYNGFSEERRKKIIHKVDVRLVPMLAILYLISHIDRANIGNAKIEGLDKDLGLTGNQYNIALSLFFIPYVLLEAVSNILLKKFSRPSVYLGILVTLWGIVMTLHGVVHNFAGLTAVRFVLGILEAGFYPGAIYLCTFWYMPKQLAGRIAWFYCASALSGAFSGLLAAGIAQMDGLRGYTGWQWIFLIEGSVTVVLGIMCFFLLVDSPRHSTKWLDSDEIRFLELQIFIKQGGRFSEEGHENFHWRDVKAIALNWRLWMQTYTLFVNSACSYGTKFTLPTITKAMGFSNTNAQLMTVPPYVAGALSAVVAGQLSDHFYWRMPFVAFPMVLITVAYSIILSLNGALETRVGPAFFAVILSCIGIYPLQPAGSSWAANNLAPAKRRAVGVAVNIAVGNIGGILGSYMYLDSEAPKYQTGFGLSLALGASGLLMSLMLELAYKWGNKKKEQMSEEEVRVKYTEDELLDMGDKSPLFRYVL